jgi:uncharacterized protein
MHVGISQHAHRRLIAAFLVALASTAETSRAADKQSPVESVSSDVKRAIASEMRELQSFTRSGVKSSADFVRPLAQTRTRAWLDAANGGLADGQFLCGVCLRDGLGTRINVTEAAQWFRKAAEQGHARAQEALGSVFFYGNGVEKSSAEAVRWYQKAVEQESVAAQFNLGVCYRTGEGVEKNAESSIYWFRVAAGQEHAGAQYNLGNAYRTGDGVEKNPAEAVRWYEKAAEQGLAESHNNLGLCYELGTGVVQNNVQACVYYLIANALNGADFEQNNLKITRARLSGAQYAAAQQAATQWVEKFRAGVGQTLDAAPTAPTPADTAKATAGSGFVISTDGYFLTCAHVVESGGEIKVRIGDKTYSAKVVRADRRNDTALLKLEGESFTPLALAQSIPEMGDKVFTIGYPNPDIQGDAAKYTDGAVSALSGFQDDVRTMQITAPIQGGNSGGALVDAAGNVVGLVVSQLNAITVFEYNGSIPQNVNFAVKINYALPLIQAVPNLARRLPPPGEARAERQPGQGGGGCNRTGDRAGVRDMIILSWRNWPIMGSVWASNGPASNLRRIISTVT